ncbi:hypothetical protein AB0D10_27175 [Kitasatospora sp. NPDC048545]|uniref:hypothetical protein n=1 Tax=Kitasatospora sp. NPDC048545 TaxID=3157208 RepID=UPI0033C6761D
MASLASHANVWETCLQLLRRRGYHLKVQLSDEEDETARDAWLAEKAGFTFWADNPIELLGLVAVYEDTQPSDDQPYWWSAKTVRERPGVREQLVDEALATQDARVAELAARRERDPGAWEAEIRAAFCWAGDEIHAAGHLGLPRAETRRILDDPRLADLREHVGSRPDDTEPADGGRGV